METVTFINGQTGKEFAVTISPALRSWLDKVEEDVIFMSWNEALKWITIEIRSLVPMNTQTAGPLLNLRDELQQLAIYEDDEVADVEEEEEEKKEEPAMVFEMEQLMWIAEQAQFKVLELWEAACGEEDFAPGGEYHEEFHTANTLVDKMIQAKVNMWVNEDGTFDGEEVKETSYVLGRQMWYQLQTEAESFDE